MARNGPNGIFVFLLKGSPLIVKASIPQAEPKSDPINKDVHAPITPVNDPIRAIKSKSPSPIPSFLVTRVNTKAINHKNPYPNPAPKILLIGMIGIRSIKLKSNPHGISARVVQREMSIVSKSERIITISAEKKIKYPQK